MSNYQCTSDDDHTLALQKANYIKMTPNNGVYYMPCKINGLSLEFVFDTGASDVVLSLTEANFMLKNGYLSEDDIRGTNTSQIADGSIQEGTTINIKKLEIGNIVLEDISASIIHSTNSPLLLGQSVLSQFAGISFDYNKEILIIHPTSIHIEPDTISVKYLSQINSLNSQLELNNSKIDSLVKFINQHKSNTKKKRSRTHPLPEIRELWRGLMFFEHGYPAILNPDCDIVRENKGQIAIIFNYRHTDPDHTLYSAHINNKSGVDFKTKVKKTDILFVANDQFLNARNFPFSESK